MPSRDLRVTLLGEYKGGFGKAADDAHGLIGKMQAAGAGVGAALSAGIANNLNMETSRARLQAQLGLTKDDAGAAGRAAAQVYRGNFGEDIGQVNDAVKLVIQTMNVDAKSADLQPITAQALSLSDAFGQDLGSTVKAAGQLMKTGLAPDAKSAMDIVARGLQVTGGQADDFLDTLNEYSTKFRDAGISGELATALISQGMKAGARDTDQVADSVKELGLRIIGGNSAGAIKQLGLNFTDVQARFARGGPEAAGAVSDIMNALRGVEDPAKRAALAFQIGGTQAEDMGQAFLALDPSSATAGLGQVAGAAQKITDTMGSGTQSTIESYRRQILGAGQDALNSVGPLAAGAGAVAAVGPAVLQVLGPMAAMRSARAVQAAAAVTAATAETAAGTATRAAWLSALGPIGLVIGAGALLAGGIVLLWQHSETFRDVVTSSFGLVARTVGDVVGFSIGLFRNMVSAWLTVIGAIIDGVAAVGKFIPGLRGPLQEAQDSFHHMKDGIVGTLTDLQQNAYGWGEKAGGNLAKGIGDQQGAVQNAAGTAAAQVNGGFSTATDHAYGYGSDAGSLFAQGLRDRQAEVDRAATAMAAAVDRKLKQMSPAKEGPLSQGGGTYGWGLKAGLLFAHGLTAAAGVVGDSASSLAGSAMPRLGEMPTGAALAAAPAPARPAPSTGAVDGPVVTRLHPDDIRALADAIADRPSVTYLDSKVLGQAVRQDNFRVARR